MSTEIPQHFRLRSYEPRNGRITLGQKRAVDALWPSVGLTIDAGLLDAAQVFGREAPRLLEIGFGSGQSLLALATAHPEKDFIGVETHKPGIGALLLGMQSQGITNLRVYEGDVIDVLEKCIPAHSLNSVQIFFPDPWPKRRHHPRRLIQSDFIKLLIKKLTTHGAIHLATDWEDYAIHMMKVMSQEETLINMAGPHQFAQRSPYRPILTKFERRAAREGRSVWELQFQK